MFNHKPLRKILALALCAAMLFCFAQTFAEVFISNTDGEVGAEFSANLSSDSITPTSWAVTGGSLPAGLTLDSGTGAISGSPTAAGSTTFTVTATDEHSATDEKEFTIQIAPSPAPPPAATPVAAPAINTVSLPDADLGDSFDQQLQTNISNAKWSVTSGRLPFGLYLSEGGKLSGTPRRAGYYTFTVQATNGTETAAKELSIYIQPERQQRRYYNPPPRYLPAPLPAPTPIPAPTARPLQPVPAITEPLPAIGETNRSVNVREKASTKSRLLGTLPKGAAITIVGFDGIHAVIEWQRGYAYVAANFITAEFEASLEVRVNKKGWTYSRGSELKKYRLTSLVAGDTLEVSGRDGKWYWINNGDGGRIWIPAGITVPIN